ncbi:MAG TPA: hypothetical protein VE684_10715 [Crenalkalicoccus sp.]|nr:hypothetical protein [Crenalkalicoccus sp.]
MIDHVSITVPDPGAAMRFHDAVMAALGVPAAGRSERWAGYGLRADAAHPARCFGTDDGAPGLGLHDHPEYYAAVLRDPAGNRVEAVCNEAPR